MSAKEESVRSPGHAVLTAGEPSSGTSYMESEFSKYMLEGNPQKLFQALKSFLSRKEFDFDGSHARGAFSAEFRSSRMRDALEKELHELKTTLAEEHEELPFRNLASTDSQDETTTACTGLTPYKYPALMPYPSAIRLVVLLPSLERHADIVCQLCNTTLFRFAADCYEALSYVWGDSTRLRPIISSSRLFRATENLEVALRNLRHPTRPRVLWIDAICINQNNFQERNEQVRLMGHIYRCARCVTVWLGPESDTSGAAFQLMHNKPEVPDFNITTHQKAKDFWRAFMSGFWGFYHLVRRPYFKRIWCIQEFALASTVYIQCGQHQVSMTDLLWMEAMIMEVISNDRLLSALTVISETGVDGGDISIRKDLSFFLKLTDLHKKLRLKGVPKIGTDLQSSSPVLDLLLTFQDWQCSDDKDRVFAFYRLLPHGSPDRDLLRPNYSLSVTQAYIRFAVRHLQRYKDMRILIIATSPLPGFVNRTATRELPSWVPDWRDVSRHGRCSLHHTIGISSVATIVSSDLVEYDTLYNACLGLKAAPFEFHDDFRTFCLGGVAVDKVAEIGHVYFGDVFSLPQAYDVLSNWKKIAALSAKRSYPYTGQLCREAFWRTLQMDDQLIFLFHLPTPTNMPTDDDVLTDGEPSSISPDSEVNDFMKRHRIPPQAPDFPPAEQDEVQLLKTVAYMHGPMLSRRFFRTAKGLFGLGPASTLVADDVAVLFGSRAPFVLRPDSDSHRVIGECYVHGIMDGEAIHRPRRREFADLSTKEFHLV